MREFVSGPYIRYLNAIRHAQRLRDENTEMLGIRRKLEVASMGDAIIVVSAFREVLPEVRAIDARADESV